MDNSTKIDSIIAQLNEVANDLHFQKQAFRVKSKAYLIAVHDKKTDELISYQVWSSPPWDQSRLYKNQYCSVAYIQTGDSFHEASKWFDDLVVTEEEINRKYPIAPKFFELFRKPFDF